MIEKIFYITLTCTAIFACMLAKNYIDARELQAQDDKNAQIKKRTKLSEYYKFEFQYAKEVLINKNSNDIDKTLAYEMLEEAEKNMIKDGYDRSEIDEIRLSGYRSSYEMAKYF